MEIVGVVGDYKSKIKLKGLVKDLNIRNLDKGLKIVNLSNNINNKDIKELSYTEIIKIELLSKIDNKKIIIGNLSNYLNYKEIDYMKKLLLKLNKQYNKNIIIVDKDITVFFNLVNKIIIKDKNKIIYETNDFYDSKLYKYANKPKIIEFIEIINKDKKRIEKHIDIYELIKDIYRGIK